MEIGLVNFRGKVQPIRPKITRFDRKRSPTCDRVAIGFDWDLPLSIFRFRSILAFAFVGFSFCSFRPGSPGARDRVRDAPPLL